MKDETAREAIDLLAEKLGFRVTWISNGDVVVTDDEVVQRAKIKYMVDEYSELWRNILLLADALGYEYVNEPARTVVRKKAKK